MVRLCWDLDWRLDRGPAYVCTDMEYRQCTGLSGTFIALAAAGWGRGAGKGKGMGV